MALPELPPETRERLAKAGAALTDYLTPVVRLGVTGLSKAGKTVFITALVRNLIAGGRMPFFEPEAEGRIVRAYLEPQPDDTLPRFDYEAHVAKLDADPPEWPESTRRISQLRVTIEYQPESVLRRTLGLSRLHVDIVDYPGEWLIDLPMLDQDYSAWSAEAFHLAQEPSRVGFSKPWRDFAKNHVSYFTEDETAARGGALLYSAYLREARRTGPGFTSLGPGRFLMPGDLEGSPLLTFLPLPITASEIKPGSFAAMMARRYESYKAHVVGPFFKHHFRRLDRQIVLIDVLGALAGGPDSVGDLERAMTSVLQVFRPGPNTWLSAITGKRIDRLLFAATKADHLNSASHDRLEALLRRLTEKAEARVTAAGATASVVALAAVRATREAVAKSGNDELPCIVGTPVPGEAVDGTTFDGVKDAAVFPGDLPADPEVAFGGDGLPTLTRVNFRPPRPGRKNVAGEIAPPPHIRLDRAIDALIGDKLK